MNRYRLLVRCIRQNERGAVLALVALGLVILLGAVALAIDIGMLMVARTESQRAADAAALAGVGSLITFPGDADRARDQAINWAAKNQVRGGPALVLEEDVDVLLAEDKVRVRVRNISERGNAVPTLFARVFGIETVNVATVAAAHAAIASSGTCPLPIALPDRWLDANGNGIYDPSDPYLSCPAEGCTGYRGTTLGPDGVEDWGDIGLLIEIKTQSGSSSGGGGGGPPGGGGGGGGSGSSSSSPCVNHPSWDCWFIPGNVNQGPGGTVGGGVTELARWIYGCPDQSYVISVGDRLNAASGAGSKQSLVTQEFRELIDSNPGIGYDPGCHCLVGANTEGNPRHRLLPVVSPTSVGSVGAMHGGTVVTFASVFIEKVASSPTGAHASGPPGQWNVYARFLGFTGLGPSTGGTVGVKVPQLVE